jgi:hypothetical protein
MQIRTLLLVAALCAAPACGQQAVKTECRNLDGSNQFVAPDEVIVPTGNGYQVCRTVQAGATTEGAPQTQPPVKVEKVPAVVAPTAQAPVQEGKAGWSMVGSAEKNTQYIPVRDFADIDNENAASGCKSHPASKVLSTRTGSTLSCSDWLAIRAARSNPDPVIPTAEVQPAPKLAVNPSPQPVKQSYVKTVSFAVANHNGGVEYYAPGWVQKWVKKNAKKYPDILFTQEKNVGNNSYLIVFSDSAHALSGFEPVTHTSTSTSTSPISGSGTVTDYYGERWNYTYDGTVTTTTTTQTTENEAYTIESSTLYATAFDSRGDTVSQHWHEYSTKSGGNAYNSLGYNLGNALAAINARGRVLSAAMKDIEGPKQKKH